MTVTLCIVAKRCVIEQKLLSTAYRKSEVVYEKSISTKMNDFDLCLEVIIYEGHVNHFVITFDVEYLANR